MHAPLLYLPHSPTLFLFLSFYLPHLLTSLTFRSLKATWKNGHIQGDFASRLALSVSVSVCVSVSLCVCVCCFLPATLYLHATPTRTPTINVALENNQAQSTLCALSARCAACNFHLHAQTCCILVLCTVVRILVCLAVCVFGVWVCVAVACLPSDVEFIMLYRKHSQFFLWKSCISHNGNICKIILLNLL